nr:hypothetical protein [Tanacetum cinerariifolium]
MFREHYPHNKVQQMRGARGRDYAIDDEIWYSVVSSEMNHLHSFSCVQVAAATLTTAAPPSRHHTFAATIYTLPLPHISPLPHPRRHNHTDTTTIPSPQPPAATPTSVTPWQPPPWLSS